ncbi:hypothetical protein ACT29H_16070 [Thermophagus sp. OGC60D27]|uniref:hypothetical protein n=1 Tax=Thermophagus sp. OGC60D27 TaxID=3458415 RepID=UPI0040384894
MCKLANETSMTNEVYHNKRMYKTYDHASSIRPMIYPNFILMKCREIFPDKNEASPFKGMESSIYLKF